MFGTIIVKYTIIKILLKTFTKYYTMKNDIYFDIQILKQNYTDNYNCQTVKKTLPIFERFCKQFSKKKNATHRQQ